MRSCTLLWGNWRIENHGKIWAGVIKKGWSFIPSGLNIASIRFQTFTSVTKRVLSFYVILARFSLL